MIDLILADPFPLTLVCGVFGLLIGSFLNVVIHRLPLMMEQEWKAECAALLDPQADPEPAPRFDLVVPRSRCPHCAKQLSALDNIPLLSYLALKGRCRHCQAPISRRYPFIEALSGVAAAIIALRFGFAPAAAFALVLTWGLIALAAIDIDTMLLPDSITMPLLWLGLIANLFNVFTSIESAVAGAILGYLALWSVYWLFKLVTGKEGMGYGDFKLLALLGAWFGWQYLPLIIILSSVVGAILGIAMMMIKSHDRSTPIPFGPYLAVAGWVALMWGEEIMVSYLRIGTS